MKKTIISIAFSLIFLSVFSQDKYTAAIHKGIGLMDSASTPARYLETANYFERIANAEQSQWLAQYYTGLALIFVAYDESKDADTRDLTYDKAMAFAEKAGKLKPDNSDVTALKGYITFMKMAVSPQARAMSMIPASNALIEKAIALDPENPRARLLKGQNLFYTPEAFGGGKSKAAEVLKIAEEKFAAQKPAGIEPAWGERRCKSLLAQSK
ncbi:MAG: hypothetical protein EOO09_04320 [Chitinophagaceae bacterium]|nr:MAG: hypothetical protein EOO09_04320 [Chitinophagaceae bacterium]